MAGEKILESQPDSNGRLDVLTDADGNSTTFDYDDFASLGAFIEKISDAEGVLTEIVRDRDGNVLRQIDRIDDQGRVMITVNEYDEFRPAAAVQ